MTALHDTSTVIVGQSGSGKTVTAKAQVQQLLAQRRHLAVIDPTGVWWGMRLDPAGEPNGAQLYVFGGEHGDVAIRPDQGAAIARIIVGQRVSAIVDLSAIDNSADWRRFAHDFVAELRRKPKGNFHLVVDEADEFAPERVPDDVGFRLRENMVWIAKRGRVHGFVPTYITQRTAEIAKAVISQAQTIVAHQLIAPSDQKAIDDYLKGHGTPSVRGEVMASLAELAVGERWIYSPRLKLLERGTTPPLATFDSSRTPGAGEQLVQPRALAELDTSAIAAALAMPADSAGVLIGDADAIAERDFRIASLERENAELDAACDRLVDFVVAIERAIDGLQRAQSRSKPGDEAPSDSEGDVEPGSRPAAGRSAAATAEQMAVTGGETLPPSLGPRAPATAETGDTAVRGRKALLALAGVAPAVLSEAQWATLSKLTKTGGTWTAYKGALRKAGYVDQDATGRWYATAAGIAAAGLSGTASTMPPAGRDRAAMWGAKIPGVRRMVDVLVKRWPHTVTRDALAADLGMAATGGTFGAYLGRLRANGVLEERGNRLRLATDVMGPTS